MRSALLGEYTPSNRYPLDDVPGDLLLPPVIEARGAGIGVAGQALDVLEGDALLQEIGDRRNAERMRRQARGQAGVPGAPLNHLADVDDVHRVFGEPSSLAVGRPEHGSILGRVPEMAASGNQSRHPISVGRYQDSGFSPLEIGCVPNFRK